MALLASVLFTLTCNGMFWRQLLDGRDCTALSTWLLAGAVAVSITAAQFAVLALVFNRWTTKPLLALLIVATAFATYYMERYGVYLDPSMLRNVLGTDHREARELVSWGMLPHLLLYAGLPLALLWRLRLRRRRLVRSLLLRPLWLALGLALGVGSLLPVFQDFASLMRNRKEMRYLVTPGNYLWSLGKVALADTRSAASPRQTVGADATRGALASRPGRKPALLVLVVGETARAASWGLNGYARSTTPRLAAIPEVINFTQASSCGTDTEVSLPCMFSPGGRRHYDQARIRRSESLLHVAQRAGVEVLWRDNQRSCKGVCDGLKAEMLSDAKVLGLCDDERCLDEVLLFDFDRVVAAVSGDQLVVLHQLGNHGPAYYRRYPEALRRFTPTCDTADLRLCTREAIINSYDNASLYTDLLLAQAIALLRAYEATHDTALLFVSDHGESLGEGNLYLHGAPFAIAPEVQTHVPMLLWLSPGFAASFHLDIECLRQRATQPVSHDHLFHTVLGLLDVRTEAREEAFDLASACRS